MREPLPKLDEGTKRLNGQSGKQLQRRIRRLSDLLNKNDARVGGNLNEGSREDSSDSDYNSDHTPID